MQQTTNKKEPLIEVRKIKKFFPLKRHSLFDRKQLYIRGNEDISFTIFKGETFGLVGESGCGKTTLGRVILQLYEPTSGSALYYGIPLRELNPQYVLNEIRKLPKYQKKARDSYQKSLIVDYEIAKLNQLLADAKKGGSIIENTPAMKVVKEKLLALQEQANQCRQEAINCLGQGGDEDGTLDEDVKLVIRLLESDADVQQAFDALYRLPALRNVKAALKELKPIININIKIAETKQEISNFNVDAKLLKKINRLEYKSKELKKEASRQLREGSKTGGELILEKDIDIIADLMLQEELNHRAAKKAEKEIALLDRKLVTENS
jgi:ABC-type oligopeptide transport system ATPase subunit